MTGSVLGWKPGHTRIECVDHPEWGTWGISDDHGGYFEIRNERGSRILDKSEARKHWHEIKRPLLDRLKAMGFASFESGGGCRLFNADEIDGDWIWISDSDGTSEPDEDGWMVGAYPKGWDGEGFDQLPYSTSGEGADACVLAALSARLALFQRREGLPSECAMDQLHRDTLTAEQRRWLSDFVQTWEREDS